METEGAESASAARATYPQFTVPIGLILGLTAAAVLCLTYGWLNRIPDPAFEIDHSAITAMLWGTTLVVAAAFGLVLATFVRRSGWVRSGTRAALWRSWSAPVLLAFAVGALVYLYLGPLNQTFTDASWQQAGLDNVQVTTVARVAWWCACLAVFGLAFVWLIGRVLPEDQPRTEPAGGSDPRLVAPLAVAVVVAVGAIVVVDSVRSAPGNTTADRVDPGLPERLSGDVAYRIDLSPRATDPTVFPGGAGFLRTSTGMYAKRVEGYDGFTGQVRWVFNLPGTGSLRELEVNGFGPESVAVLRASYRTASQLIGLDATTGKLLWSSDQYGEYDFAVGPVDWPQLSTQVVFLGQQVPGSYSSWREPAEVDWTAVSPRTGETMWSTTVPRGCRAQPRVARAVVVMVRCDASPEGDEVADLLDPRTGDRTGVITASQLGADRRGTGMDGEVWVYTHPESNFAIVRFRSSDPHRPDLGRVIDLSTGRLAYSLPNGVSAAIIAPDWLRSDEHSETVVDLQNGKAWPTDRTAARTLVGVGRQWAQVGPELATLLPPAADPGDAHAPLTLIDRGGSPRTLANPCAAGAQRDTAPSVTTIPGALLVDCGVQLVGLH